MESVEKSDQCISSMDNPIQWHNFDGYSPIGDLANHEEGGLDMNSTTPNNDGDGVREWSDFLTLLDIKTPEIKLWGAD